MYASVRVRAVCTKLVEEVRFCTLLYGYGFCVLVEDVRFCMLVYGYGFCVLVADVRFCIRIITGTGALVSE